MPPSCSTLAQLNSSFIKLSAFLSYALLPCPHSFNRYFFAGNEEEAGGSSKSRRRRGKGHSVNRAQLLPERRLSTLTSVRRLFLIQVHQSCQSERSRRSLKRRRLMHNNTSTSNQQFSTAHTLHLKQYFPCEKCKKALSKYPRGD